MSEKSKNISGTIIHSTCSSEAEFQPGDRQHDNAVKEYTESKQC